MSLLASSLSRERHSSPFVEYCTHFKESILWVNCTYLNLLPDGGGKNFISLQLGALLGSHRLKSLWISLAVLS